MESLLLGVYLTRQWREMGVTLGITGLFTRRVQIDE